MYKVIVVDDEPVIRQGMLCFINWESLSCTIVYEAGNGIEANEYIKSNPVDIIIADIKMPGMDGIELAKNIYEQYPNIKVIILTAFADFSYAQQAIKYNVVDFVIKTNPSEKIPEAIQKAKELIESEKDRERKLEMLKSKINDNISEISEKFLKDIINGIVINPSVIAGKVKELDIKLDNYFLIAYEINKSSEETTDDSIEEHNKFIFSVKNFLSLAFKDYYHYTIIMNKNMLITIVSFSNYSSSKCTQSLLMTCNEILSMADGFMKLTINIGISSVHKHISELPKAYSEANEALAGSFYNDNQVSVYLAQSNMHISTKVINIHEYADKIVSNIQNGNYSGAISFLLELFDKYRKNKEPIENIKVSSLLICSQCFRILGNYKLNIQDYMSNETNVYKLIQDSKSINALSPIICNVIKSTSNIITDNEKQYNYLVREVNRYIRDNYSTNIGLQSIADFVHVNSSYLSRLYKKETGVSIIDSINKYRIEMAKKLLKDPANKIFEVAVSVGIEDATYFTHVFTKYVGMSPKEYKSMNV